MDLSFLIEQQQEIEKRLSTRFRNQRIEHLETIPQERLVLPAECSEIQRRIYDRIIGDGVLSVQRFKIIVINNMTDSELFEYIDNVKSLNNMLNNLIKKFKSISPGAKTLDNILYYLNLEFYVDGDF